jgi:hypothetical protein
VQYFTPNKVIYRFPYANEFVLKLCAERNIGLLILFNLFRGIFWLGARKSRETRNW